MMKFRLRLSAVVGLLLLVVFPDLITSQRPRAADAPGPYVLTDLGTLGGLSAQAYDINEAGDIVGSATNSTLRLRAFVWRNGSMTDLGTIGGNHSEAVAISDTGHVVGRSQTSTSKYHAILWSGGTTTDLTPSSDYAVAYGVNDIGQVVGSIDNWKGFVWHNLPLVITSQLRAWSRSIPAQRPKRSPSWSTATA
jgi:probable HAF family extracellular repeat protein